MSVYFVPLLGKFTQSFQKGLKSESHIIAPYSLGFLVSKAVVSTESE